MLDIVALCCLTCLCAGLLGISLDGLKGLIICCCGGGGGGCVGIVVSGIGGGGAGSVGGVLDIFIGEGWFVISICGGGGGLILLLLGLSLGGT